MNFLARMIPEPLRRGLRNVALTIHEALGGGAVGNFGSVGDPNLYGYQRITDRVLGAKYRRDLDSMSQLQMLQIAHFLYTSNGLAQWIIDVRVDIVVGAELSYTLEYDAKKLGIEPEKAKELAQDARVFLDQWWKHPAHSFETKAAEYASTYLLTGELLLNVPEASRNPTTGAFVLDYIDSEAISNVLPLSDLATTPGFVVVGRTGQEAARLKVIMPKPDGSGWEGDCFFFRHARRLNALRGLSDLLPLADWLDMRDQFLFSGNDAALLRNNLVHDLKIEGSQTDNQLLAEAKKFREATAKPGGVYVHNEKITYEQVAPELEASDQSVLARMLLLNILGARGIPEHWYSEGSQANKATAGEQTDVTTRALQALQTELRRIYELPLQVAYDALAMRQGMFPQRSDGAVTLRVNLPLLSSRDTSRLAVSMVQLESALSSAVDAGRVSTETARGVLVMMLDALGYPVDKDDEAKRVDEEAEAREAKAMEVANQMAANAVRDANVDDDPDNPEGTRTVDDTPDAPRAARPTRREGQPTPRPPAEGGPQRRAPEEPHDDVAPRRKPAGQGGDDDQPQAPPKKEAQGLAVNLNGAQIQAATAIVQAVADGSIPRDSGIAQLEILFGLDNAQAQKLVGTAGTKTPTTPNPIGGPGKKDAAPSPTPAATA